MWTAPMYDTTKLTVELGELIDHGFVLFDFEYEHYHKTATIGDKTVTVSSRDLERKILDHFRFRQIGQETPARFKHMFKAKFLEIWPYYYELYDSVFLMASQGDPFEAYNLTETFKETRKGSTSGSLTTNRNNTGNTTTTEDKTSRRLNTPMGQIALLDDGYLTEATKDNGTTGSQGSETVNGQDTTTGSDSQDNEYTMTRRGNIGVQPLGSEVEAYRKAIINVDVMIINELNGLFLGVY